jgi:antitoxin (DNA-binding transcriptional repressor) of toxin-antitoxin stability system
MYHMKQASVRDLRYSFSKIERLLRQGQEIEITKRHRVIARLLPEKQGAIQLPDFMGRLRAIYGDRMPATTGAEIIAEDRERY